MDNKNEKCNRLGYLTVSGRKVGLVRCQEHAGHDGPREWRYPENPFAVFGGATSGTIAPTPHRAALTWSDDSPIDWPEAYDPAEPIDVDVPEDVPSDYVAPSAPRLDYVPPCPECAAGKHGNCDGSTWDNARDMRAPCPCCFSDHAQALHVPRPAPPYVEPPELVEPPRSRPAIFTAILTGACGAENESGERCAYVVHDGRHTWEL